MTQENYFMPVPGMIYLRHAANRRIRLTEGKRKVWLVGMIALAAAGVVLPASGSVPESVTIPLKVVHIQGVGVKVGIEVSLGGGMPRLYTFDTGSSGMYAAYNPEWWPTFDPISGPPIPQSYGSGLTLEANRVSTIVSIPTDQGEISFTTEVGQITKAAGTPDGTAWLANVGAGEPPLYGMFFGDFGSGLTKPAEGLFAVLPQLPGNLSSGFAVKLGCGGSPNTEVVVGLTKTIRSRVTSWVKMEKDSNSPPYPNSNQPTYRQAVLNGNFSLAYEGTFFPFSVPAILDTEGGGTTNIHQQTLQLMVPDDLVLEPGAHTTRVVSCAQFRVTAPGTTTGTDFDMAFVTGSTPTIDQINVSQPKSSKTKAEVNLGLIPFFRYDVVFDIERGNVGFAPSTVPGIVPSAPTEPTVGIPVLSSWAMGLLALGLALIGALAITMRTIER